MTVTQRKAYWVIPNGIKEVPCSRIRDIEFSGKKKCWAAIEMCEFRSSLAPAASKSPSPVIKTTDPSRTKNFYL